MNNNIISEIKLSYKRVELTPTALTSSLKVHDFIRDYLNVIDEDITLQEKFFVVFFDIAMKAIGFLKVAESGIDAVMVDNRLIYTTALQTGAKSVILFHNHPSGNMKPSDADKNITNKIKKGLDIFDIKVIDHLILSGTRNEYYSFLDEGLL